MPRFSFRYAQTDQNSCWESNEFHDHVRSFPWHQLLRALSIFPGLNSSHRQRETPPTSMSQAKTSPFKTYFDEIAESNGDDECKAWLIRILESKSEIAEFVSRRRLGGGVGTYSGFLKGSFNFSFRVNFSDA
ncbi:hypothetical protein RBB50_011744 [Rhinocladiella similis]